MLYRGLTLFNVLAFALCHVFRDFYNNVVLKNKNKKEPDRRFAAPMTRFSKTRADTKSLEKLAFQLVTFCQCMTIMSSLKVIFRTKAPQFFFFFFFYNQVQN